MSYFVIKITLSIDANLKVDFNLGAKFDHLCKI